MTANAPEQPGNAPILGRDDKGRFIRGNPGGPGNPFARKTAALRSALIRKMDEERIERLADKLLEQALDGDVSAARLVLQYAVGKPTAAIDPDDLDRLEWEHELQQVVPVEEMTAARTGVPAAFATMSCSILRACNAAEMADHLSERIDAMDKAGGEESEEEAPAPPSDEAPAAPVEQAEEPVVIRMPEPVSKREKSARRCANPVRSVTPDRHPTVVSPGDGDSQPAAPARDSAPRKRETDSDRVPSEPGA